MRLRSLYILRETYYLIIGGISMSFDQWLLDVKRLTWEQYLGLSEEEQDKLSDEYEDTSQNWK